MDEVANAKLSTEENVPDIVSIGGEDDDDDLGEESLGELTSAVGKTEVPDVQAGEQGYGELEAAGEWPALSDYGEARPFYPFRYVGEGSDYSSEWEKQGSVASEVTTVEVEETEEEREARKEREQLIEDVRQKMLDRLSIRRRNAFLHKKLADYFKKRRMDNVFKDEPRGLDLEKKYLTRLYIFQDFKSSQEKEIDELTRTMDQYEKETKFLEKELEEKMTSFTDKAKEVSLNLILSKTGKKISEKTVDRLLARHLKKNEEKGEKRLQYIKVKNLIEEKEARLRAMEYIAEGLNIAHCEQMKIDNQNFSDKIEEKEDELTKMRIKTQDMMQNLAQIREKSYAIDGDIELMEEKVYAIENKFVETRERVTKARKRRDYLREEYLRLKASSGLLTRDNLLEDFETSIVAAKALSKQLEKLKRLMQEKTKQEVELSREVSKSKSKIEDLVITRSDSIHEKTLSARFQEFIN